MKRFTVAENIEVGSGRLLIIAGPCVIESESVCMKCAEFMAGLCSKHGFGYVFKASFDKANRSSGSSFRGPGYEKGLAILAKVKKEFGLPLLTDIHETGQAKICSDVAEILQIPAFLCRQTDLLEAAAATGRVVNVKKGQFMAPEDMNGAVEKVKAKGNERVMLTERGTSFGYHNLVVDMRSLVIMSEIGVPVVFDATHSVQLPGGLGSSSGGQRQFVRPLAEAALAVGIDALFLELHPDPSKALSDGPNSLDFPSMERLLDSASNLHELGMKSRKERAG